MRDSGCVSRILFFLVVCSAATGLATAQGRIDFSDQSTLVVDGTSNQSDWTVTADSLYGWVELAPGENGRPDVMGAELHVLSGEIVSNRSPIMDRLMRRALKTSDNPEIVFEMTGKDLIPVAETDSFAVATTGNLSIAGATNEAAVVVGGKSLGDGVYRFSGSYEMKMTDFGIDPPTALFGALHTGDAVVVRFDLYVTLD